MKIFHLCADPGIAPDGSKGASVHLRALAEALAANGHVIHSFTRRAPISGHVPVRPDQSAIDTPSWHRLSGTDSLLEAARLLSRPDAIYERYALAHLDGLRAARLLDVPFVLEVNAPLVAETRTHRPLRLKEGVATAEAELWRDADLVVTVSEPLRAAVTRARGSDEGTLVIPNGVTPRLHSVATPVARASDATLVFLGHPKPWHGAEQLVQLLRTLRRTRDVRLLVIGGGPGAARLHERAEQLCVAEAVEITGALPHDKAVGQLKRGTLLVAPYPWQAPFYFCPIKLLEGMASGLPIVATAQGDLSDLIADAGLLVEPDDPRALHEAVERLLRSPKLRRELGTRGRKRALAYFTWEAAAQTLELSISRLTDVAVEARVGAQTL